MIIMKNGHFFRVLFQIWVSDLEVCHMWTSLCKRLDEYVRFSVNIGKKKNVKKIDLSRDKWLMAGLVV